MTKRERSRLRLGGVIVIGVALVAIALPLFFEAGEIFPTRAAPKTQPPGMELRGNWLGMSLAATDSPTAWQLGVPQDIDGVVVVEVSATPDPRGMQAGIAPGDVIQKVNRRAVESLSELFTATTRLDAMQPVQMQILRQNIPMNVMVAPASAPPGGMAPFPADVATPAALPWAGRGLGRGFATTPCPYPGYGAGVVRNGASYGYGTGAPAAPYPYPCVNTMQQ